MFIDESLLDRVAYGFRGGPQWSTTRVELQSGRIKRNAERSLPRHRYVAPYTNIDEDYRDIVIATYIACMGPIHSFRFKDYNDNYIDDEIIGTSVGGIGETMQVIKPYTFGTETLSRPITKPIAAGFVLTEDDIPLVPTDIDELTGIITFNATGAGKVLRVTCDFDVPVMFDEDGLDFSFETLHAISGEIVLVEDFTT